MIVGPGAAHNFHEKAIFLKILREGFFKNPREGFFAVFCVFLGFFRVFVGAL